MMDGKSKKIHQSKVQALNRQILLLSILILLLNNNNSRLLMLKVSKYIPCNKNTDLKHYKTLVIPKRKEITKMFKQKEDKLINKTMMIQQIKV